MSMEKAAEAGHAELPDDPLRMPKKFAVRRPARDRTEPVGSDDEAMTSHIIPVISGLVIVIAAATTARRRVRHIMVGELFERR
jgi:hypothetical protein